MKTGVYWGLTFSRKSEREPEDASDIKGPWKPDGGDDIVIVRPYATDVGIKPDETAIRMTERFFRREFKPTWNDLSPTFFRTLFGHFPGVNVTRSVARSGWHMEERLYAPFSPKEGKLFVIPSTPDSVAYGFVSTPPDMDFLGISPICRM